MSVVRSHLRACPPTRYLTPAFVSLSLSLGSNAVNMLITSLSRRQMKSCEKLWARSAATREISERLNNNKLLINRSCIVQLRRQWVCTRRRCNVNVAAAVADFCYSTRRTRDKFRQFRKESLRVRKTNLFSKFLRLSIFRWKYNIYILHVRSENLHKFLNHISTSK